MNSPRKAKKDLENLPQHVANKAAKAINGLVHNPRPPGCRKLEGQNNHWRIRIGDYRIVYTIEDNILTIQVIRIRHRKNVYH